MTPAQFTTIFALATALAMPVTPAAQAAKPAPTQAGKPATAQPAKPAPAKPGAAQTAKPKPPDALSAAATAKLKNPAALKDVAPAEYRASFDTSAGPFEILVHRDWAPKGADRFYNLVKYGFFDDARFFRVLPNFMVQFGINGNPAVQGPWREANIDDEPVKQSNKRGMITFAKSSAPNSRTTQVFINFRDNANLDPQGFSPFGEVVSGMEVVDKISAEYRDFADQMRIQSQGNAYLTKEFPRMDYVKKATIVGTPATPVPAKPKG